jgi:hypothetical protein
MWAPLPGYICPPQKRPCGTFNFEHNFAEGKSAGALKLHYESGEHVSRFPFAAGVSATPAALHYSSMFSLLIAGGGALIRALRTKLARVF